MKKPFTSFCVILAVSLWVVIATAQETSATAETPGVSAPPQPADLRPDWMRYFSADREDLGQRVETAIGSLRKSFTRLDARQQENARQLLQQVTVNLSALPRLHAKELPETPAIPRSREHYTITEWLELEDALRLARQELQDARQILARESKAMKAARKRLDTAMAAYLSMPSAAPDKSLTGLKIVAAGSALLVEEAKLRFPQAEVEIREQLLARLTEMALDAAGQLRANDQEAKSLAAIRKQREQDLVLKQQQIRNAQEKTIGVIGDDEISQSRERLYEQQALLASVEMGLAEVRLARTSAEQLLLRALQNDKNLSKEKVYSQVRDWLDLAESTEEDRRGWGEITRRERDQAQLQLSGMEQGVGEAEIQRNTELRIRVATETLVALKSLQSAVADLGLVAQRLRDEQTTGEGTISRWSARGLELAGDQWKRSRALASESLFRIGDTPVTLLGLLRAAIIILIAWWLSKVVRRAVGRYAREREGADTSGIYTVGRLLLYSINILGFVIALSTLGIDFSNFALVAGALSIGVGFGLQSIINNFVSGLILLFERSLKVGDFIELDSGVTGIVKAINVRSTLVNTNDNIDIIVPNSEFISGRVINWTLKEAIRRIHVPFGVAYGTDKELVRTAALEAAENVPYTHSAETRRKPAVWFVNFGDSSLDFELVVWVNPKAVKRPGAILATYLWEIETALRKYGIEVPFPQRDLHLKSGFSKVDPQPPGTPAAG